eukprot:CAMPEP_0177768158 /NCGR_PEP_ID=MMETSP0491_2-20121128/9561_1 /TAXON_ID=63592 /ORGANISM="Tetraselmis chuii, Strain PLY429" /LENGTH=43 /DNA_ID= /DNA_START= /DNA_END= /DNA_ORIENTATION=
MPTDTARQTGKDEATNNEEIPVKNMEWESAYMIPDNLHDRNDL